MQPGPMHEWVKPLCWLIGKWKIVSGVVNYPTMKKPIKYAGKLDFVSFGQPLLSYTSVTWNAEDKSPMHFESGFLRISEDGCSVALLTGHNFGVGTVEEGQVRPDCLILKTTTIGHMKFVRKEVKCLTRRFSINEKGELEYNLMMQTCDTPLCDHANAVHVKDC